jgi:hypothetical protein
MDIQKWAGFNGLTPDEFKKEIYTYAACLGAMDLDARGARSDELMRFTTTGETGTIEVFVRYKPEEINTCALS